MYRGGKILMSIHGVKTGIAYFQGLEPIQMIQRKKPDVDIIKEVLNAVLDDNPGSTFTQSLSYQYEERGGLSKSNWKGSIRKRLK